jgi:hypothetical protein
VSKEERNMSRKLPCDIFLIISEMKNPSFS